MPLQIGKTPIVVPRQHQFNEHVNDHQVEFARNVAQRMGTIIPVEDINTLGDVIMNYDQIVAGINVAKYITFFICNLFLVDSFYIREYSKYTKAFYNVGNMLVKGISLVITNTSHKGIHLFIRGC